mgnify:FL=1
MKTIKLLLILILGLILSSCEPDEVAKKEEPECKCIIKGTMQISFDKGKTWKYNGTDGRTGYLFPCFYDGMVTSEEVRNGVNFRTIWSCF